MIPSLLAAGALPCALAAAISHPQSQLTPPGLNYILPDGFPVPNATESYWQDPPHRIANLRTTEELPSDQVFDYVIIGSGITGAATAHKLLTRNPALTILMLEGRTAASGATGRNGGHCRPGSYKNLKRWTETYGEDEAVKLAKMEQDCVDDVANFVKQHNVDSGFQTVESADLYWTQEALDEALDVLAFQRDMEARRPGELPDNPRTEYLGQAARDHWGWPQILGAVTFTAHTQNPYLTVARMLELSLDRGMNLQTGTMALRLTQLDDARWMVLTDRGAVTGKQVVLATNAYTNVLHPGFASSGFLVPGRSQCSAVRPSAWTPDNPVFHRSSSYPDFPSGNNYIVVRAPGDPGEGDVIYGGSKKLSPSGEANITDDSVVNEAIASTLNALGRITYGYENWGTTTEVKKEWTGITCDTPDGLPVVGGVPGEDGLWASVCMNGHGMAWGFRSAEALVQMMEEGTTPEWFPTAFRSERVFEQKTKEDR